MRPEDLIVLKKLDTALKKASFEMIGEEYLSLAAAWFKLREMIQNAEKPKSLDAESKDMSLPTPIAQPATKKKK